MKTSDFLVLGKSLIDTPEKWLQGSLAGVREVINETKIVQTKSPGNEMANCFCSMGALMKVRSSLLPHEDNGNEQVIGVNLTYREAESLLNKAAEELSDDPKVCYVAYNDAIDHNKAMVMWDRAIYKARRAGR